MGRCLCFGILPLFRTFRLKAQPHLSEVSEGGRSDLLSPGHWHPRLRRPSGQVKGSPRLPTCWYLFWDLTRFCAGDTFTFTCYHRWSRLVSLKWITVSIIDEVRSNEESCYGMQKTWVGIEASYLLETECWARHFSSMNNLRCLITKQDSKWHFYFKGICIQ